MQQTKLMFDVLNLYNDFLKLKIVNIILTFFYKDWTLNYMINNHLEKGVTKLGN